ncbi:hypothetical protein [Chitinophaga lutea]|nr:hypothetical protein [Chitinophaga lutea]
MWEQKSTIGYDEVALPRPIIPGRRFAAAKAFRRLERSLPLGGNDRNNGNNAGVKGAVGYREVSTGSNNPKGNVQQQGEYYIQ